MTKIRTLILNGFLGSGKTTLLRSLLAQASGAGLSVGVVVNDMSELDVDGLLVIQSEYFDEQDPNFQSIHSCLLSSRKGLQKLRRALEEMRAGDPPDLLIVEMSGGSHPMPLVEFFRTRSRFELTGVLTLVDAAMIDEDYAGGQRIVPTMQRNLQNRQRDTTNLLVEQILFCSHLLLTKTDRVEEPKLQSIARSVQELNPYVSVGSVPWGNLPLDDVLAIPAYDYDKVAKLVEELRSDPEWKRYDGGPSDLATRVLRDDRPFHPQRLWDTVRHQLGRHIYRSKGFFYLPTRDHMSLLWNQAAGGINLELVGYWRAGILEDESNNLNDEEEAMLREMLAKSPGRFGDRHCHLTIIGDESQVDRFAELLQQCFLTEDEIEHWQSGGDFPDPWPTDFVARS